MISIDKVTLNVGIGAAGEKLEKAKKLLSTLVDQKPIETKSTKRIPTWGIRKGLPIGAKVTLRKEAANKVLDMCLEAVDRQLKEKSFDDRGNFSFGIKEYIDIPGMKYDPEIGMMGFDVCITLKKWGYRTSQRKRQKRKIPLKHVVKKEEAIAFAKEKLKAQVIS